MTSQSSLKHKILNTKKLTHKRYSKSDPQTLLKNWPANVTPQLTQKLYSKSDPQALLKKWSTNVNQKLTHKRYSKSDPQTLLKMWSTNVTQKLTHKRSSLVAQLLTFCCISVFSFLVCYQLFKLLFNFGFGFLIF